MLFCWEYSKANPRVKVGYLMWTQNDYCFAGAHRGKSPPLSFQLSHSLSPRALRECRMPGSLAWGQMEQQVNLDINGTSGFTFPFYHFIFLVSLLIKVASSEKKSGTTNKRINTHSFATNNQYWHTHPLWYTHTQTLSLTDTRIQSLTKTHTHTHTLLPLIISQD